MQQRNLTETQIGWVIQQVTSYIDEQRQLDGYFDFDGATEIEEAIIVLPGMVPCEVTI